jgi:hypothetical protein
MKKTLLSVCLLLAFYSLLAQKGDTASVVTLWKASLLNPGVSFEKAVGKRTTVTIQAALNMGAAFNLSKDYFEDHVKLNSYFFGDPGLSLGYRYYYNSAKRIAKNKNISRNSLNYLSAVFNPIYSDRLYFDLKKERIYYRSGIFWGLQRNYLNRISLDFNIGCGLIWSKGANWDAIAAKYVDEKICKTTSMSQVVIGIWLGRRTRKP